MGWSERLEFELYEMCQVSVSFMDLMVKSLKKDFKLKTHFKIDDKKHVIALESLTFPTKPTIEELVIECRFVVVYQAHDVKIRWKPLKDKVPILPSDEVTENDVEFWWEFPQYEDLIDSLKGFNTPIKLPFSLKIFRFKVKCYQLVGIDVIFKLQLSETLADTTIADTTIIETIIDDIGESWNDAEANRPPFHNWWLDEKRSKAKEYVIFFDLGYASMDGIKYILEKLNESSLPVDKIIIDNA